MADQSKEASLMVMHTALVKAFHMIIFQRCSSVAEVETLNTFNLSTSKTAVPSPSVLQTVHLSIYLADSSHDGQRIGMEQWKLSFIPGTTALSSTPRTQTPDAVFKKFCVLFRSLYSTLRFLPAYRLVKRSRTGAYISTFRYTEEEQDHTFVGESAQEREFRKISTPFGDFSISVLYRLSCPMSLLKAKQLTTFIQNQYEGEAHASAYFEDFFKTPSNPSNSATDTSVSPNSLPSPAGTSLYHTPVINIPTTPTQFSVLQDSPRSPQDAPTSFPSLPGRTPTQPISISRKPFEPESAFSPTSFSYTSTSIGQSPIFLIPEYEADPSKKIPEELRKGPVKSPPFLITKQTLEPSSMSSYSMSTSLTHSPSFRTSSQISVEGDTANYRPRNSAPFFVAMNFEESSSPAKSSGDIEDIDYAFATVKEDEANVSDFVHFLETIPSLSQQSPSLNVDFCLQELSRMRKYVSR
jgi:hypothetical protein